MSFRAVVFLSLLLLAGCAAPRAQMPPALAQTSPLVGEAAGEGADLEVGGFGLGGGHFTRLRDLAFAPDGRLFTLESAGQVRSPDGDVLGLGRVQVFDGNGQFQSAFSLGGDAQAESAQTAKGEDGPMVAAHIALDGQGRVYVSFPLAGLVRVFNPDGSKIADVRLPFASALARRADGKIEALASARLIERGRWTWKGGDTLFVLNGSTIESQTKLGQTLWNVADMDTFPNGDIAVLGAPSRDKYYWNPQPMIWRFDAAGHVLSSIGTGGKTETGEPTRSEEGDEPLHSLVVTSDGSIETVTYGNPGFVIAYRSDGTTLVRRRGQFRDGDPWIRASGYTILALDPSGRLWVGVSEARDPRDPNFARHSDRPVVLRTRADFLDPAQKGVLVSDQRALSFKATLSTALAFNISYSPNQPITVDLTIAPARRAPQSAGVSFRVFDESGSVVAQDEQPLSLRDGLGNSLSFSWTPPRYGAYAVVATAHLGQTPLRSQALMVGVSPRYPNLPELTSSPGGWEDAPRQAFTGLRLMRLHPDKGMEKLDADLSAAQASGDLAFVQLTDKKDKFTPQRASEVMERIKGRVRYVELFNEPNFKWKPAEYVALAKPIYDAIKAVDPGVQVLGPAPCGVKLDWLDGFYRAGGKDTCDILSVHDYEGHESISPEHWTWKFGALRALMTRYGDGNKPVWQTERAISSVRGGTLTGLSQAIRITLHRDLLSSLGVPDDHNALYYLNQGGYSSVPSYVWSDQGPLPAALALRTRAGLLGSRAWLGTLNFGPTGRTLFLGERYGDASGEVVSLRNLVGGTLRAHFAASPDAQVFDAWGNRLSAPLQNGTLALDLGQLPTYVRVSPGGALRPLPWNWGPDLALNASVEVQGQAKNDATTLTNGQLKTIHDGNPRGGTDGKAVVQLLAFSPQQPALVSLQLPAPTRFSALIVRGLRADNAFSALRAFDVQAQVGGSWKTLATYNAPIPPSVPGRVGDAGVITFYGDDNAVVLRFPSVQSDALRLVVKKGTFGFAPDETARDQVVRTWGGANPHAASLREIEIYNAP